MSIRFADWPLRAKMAVLLATASTLPLAAAALLDVRQTRQRLVAQTAALLSARGDQLVGGLDGFNRAYRRAAERFARLPDIIDACEGSAARIGEVLAVQGAGDPNVRGAAVLDRRGVVRAATEPALIAKDLSFHRYVREAIQSQRTTISDVHFAEAEVGSTPTITYLAPVKGGKGEVTGFMAIFVRADALWELARRFNELAGPGSFAVLFDRDGVRIAHTYSHEIVFHPGGPLEPALVESLTAEGRFGDNTRALLQDVRAFPDQFDRARATALDPVLFHGYAPVNQKWNYGVGRRLETVRWTLFYMLPEQDLLMQIARLTREKLGLASGMIVLALLAGALFASVILRPIQSLARATKQLAAGDLQVRIEQVAGDEIGSLGVSFNHMAERIANQSAVLVQRAVQLEAVNKELEAFAYSVSHDLRGPLRSLDGFSQALLEDYSGKLDDQGKDYLNRIGRASQRMGNLIDDLLKLSRLSRQPLKMNVVDLSVVAQLVVEELRTTTPRRDVAIEITPGLTADGDPELLQIVFQNLLSNAWKFTAKRDDARIEVGATVLDGERVVFVRDNGAGFDMAYAGKLFGAFQRLHSVAEFEGNGIGLATVQRIIRRHGGRVWAEGVVGQGASFYFTLKAKERRDG